MGLVEPTGPSRAMTKALAPFDPLGPRSSPVQATDRLVTGDIEVGGQPEYSIDRSDPAWKRSIVLRGPIGLTVIPG